jgi:hypothetical protein
MKDQLILTENCKLSDIHCLLASHYENLDIRFYVFQSLQQKAFGKESLVTDGSLTLRDIRYNQLKGDIYFQPETDKYAIEKKFRKNGLHVLVNVCGES